MTDRDDKEMLAAEYVIGTLDDAERAEVAARRQRESDLDEAINEWDERMSPLLARVGDAVPRADLFESIQEKIEAGRSPDGAAKEAVADITVLQSRISRWRMAAISASAVAAGLAGFILYKDALQPPVDQRFVAVFQEGDQPPQFVLSINLETRVLKIRPVAAKSHPGKTYQLWIKADPLGPDPKSLGLLDRPENPTSKQLQQFDPDLLQRATFGISLEEEGGSKSGKPSPGALHGKLIPTAL